MSQSSDDQAPNGGSTNETIPAASTQAEMAKAFNDLARGEQQAAALEANLTSLESKLDALLASIEGGSPSVGSSQGKDTDAGTGRESEKK